MSESVRCGYHNKDDTCNCTRLCTRVEPCIAIESNFRTVEDRATADIVHAYNTLKEIMKRRRENGSS